SCNDGDNNNPNDLISINDRSCTRIAGRSGGWRRSCYRLNAIKLISAILNQQ
uniref:Uncharacterized protein n=1 Tax=Amphimedon queenslandica TaxID=400682 RepID=A0A1X7UBP3_AMPQE